MTPARLRCRTCGAVGERGDLDELVEVTHRKGCTAWETSGAGVEIVLEPVGTGSDAACAGVRILPAQEPPDGDWLTWRFTGSVEP